MLRIMQGLLALLFGLGIAGLYFEGVEQGALILVLAVFTARVYQLLTRRAKRCRDDVKGFAETSSGAPSSDDASQKELHGIQVFTVVLVFLSFYWPLSVYVNAGLLVCFFFHLVAERYGKRVIS